MKIEIIDLKKRFLDEKKDLLICINKVLKKGNLVLTSEVENFEKKICKYTGSKYCLGLNSGTDALMMSLWSNGITKGDEVITSPISFIASSNSIIHVGAKPVFVDVDYTNCNINLEQIPKKINKKTKAIIGVSLFGQMYDVIKMKKISKKFNIPVIEDGAQSFGSRYKNIFSCN